MEHKTFTEWLDASEVCQMLKISKRCLQNYRLKKILKYSRIGGKIYFKKKDLEELLENNYMNFKN
ncbi:MAG: helix-turn-helix domain-containing protein [Bacteroidales bacterium]|nr:helix-turn-helix domain-containing protein [Bacteroidales bacterium]